MPEDKSLDGKVEEERARAEILERSRKGIISAELTLVRTYFSDLRATKEGVRYEDEPEYEEVTGGWTSTGVMNVPTGRTESVRVDEMVPDNDRIIRAGTKLLELFGCTRYDEVRGYIMEEAKKIDGERGDTYYSGLMERAEIFDHSKFEFGKS